MALSVTACGRRGYESPAEASAGASAAKNLSGTIEADGSSTVAPLTTAAAEGFRANNPDVNITVGTAGTGGGFERFCRGETDLSNASRPIKEDEEAPLCKENGIAYTAFQVATDALTVAVNSENDWIECMTTEQLKAIWEPGSKITNWSQVPDGDYPNEPVTLFGPGTDSGTFDYFTDEVVGEEGASRSDYSPSEDDNVIVTGIAGERGALGYLGFTYYEENEDKLKALEIDAGDGCVAPSAETAQAGEYTPLSRPLYVYVKNASLRRREVAEFLRYYLENAAAVAEEARFIPLTDEQQAEALATFEKEGGGGG